MVAVREHPSCERSLGDAKAVCECSRRRRRAEWLPRSAVSTTPATVTRHSTPPPVTATRHRHSHLQLPVVAHEVQRLAGRRPLRHPVAVVPAQRGARHAPRHPHAVQQPLPRRHGPAVRVPPGRPRAAPAAVRLQLPRHVRHAPRRARGPQGVHGGAAAVGGGQARVPLVVQPARPRRGEGPARAPRPHAAAAAGGRALRLELRGRVDRCRARVEELHGGRAGGRTGGRAGGW
jgi:hypothetical protein